MSLYPKLVCAYICFHSSRSKRFDIDRSLLNRFQLIMFNITKIFYLIFQTLKFYCETFYHVLCRFNLTVNESALKILNITIINYVNLC